MNIIISEHLQMVCMFANKSMSHTLTEYEMLFYEATCNMLQKHAQYFETVFEFERMKLQKAIEERNAGKTDGSAPENKEGVEETKST